MPFDDEDIKAPRASGLKIGINKPPPQERLQQRQEFEKKVSLTEKSISDKKRKIVEIVNLFNTIVTDKTITSNQDGFFEETEKEIKSQLIILSNQMNEDPNETEGSGSLLCITLLMNAIFGYRNRINNLEFELKNLKKEFNALKKDLGS